MEQPTITIKLHSTNNKTETIENVAKNARDVEQCHKLLDLIINNAKNWNIKYDLLNMIVRSEDEYKVLCKYREFYEWKTVEICETVMSSMEVEPEEIKYVPAVSECPQVIQQPEPIVLPKFELKPKRKHRFSLFH
jgi:hypothetical protein